MKSLYRLDQFDRVLALRNRDGLPYLLIGGQAVNFWAGLYAVRESALADLKPFTIAKISTSKATDPMSNTWPSSQVHTLGKAGLAIWTLLISALSAKAPTFLPCTAALQRAP